MIFGKTLDQKFTARNWFAWYPVRLKNGRFIWLETIWKKPLRQSCETVWIYQQLKDAT